MGQQVYNYRCYFCHGYSGNAKTLASSYLTPPPVDFTALTPQELSVYAMRQAILNGKTDTAMMSFKFLLSSEEVEAVIYFVREAFMANKMLNTKYHTEENGWFEHQRYAIAYPFVSGEIPLDTAWEDLTEQQRKGKQLYLNACVSCHDRAKVNNEGVIWEGFPLSWPRNAYDHKKDNPIDALSQASPYHIHDIEVLYTPASEAEKKGQKIFKDNCTFCHANDGSGKNWIGQFIEPHPRDFTRVSIQNNYTKQSLKNSIQFGVKNTAMPAWRYVLTEQEIDDVIAYMWQKFK